MAKGAGSRRRLHQAENFLHWDTYGADAATNVADYDDTLATYFSDYGRPSFCARPPVPAAALRHVTTAGFEALPLAV